MLCNIAPWERMKVFMVAPPCKTLYDFCRVFKVSEKVMCFKWCWNTFFGGATRKILMRLQRSKLFVPQNCPRGWVTMKRDKYLLHLNLFSPIAPGTNFMLHHVFFCCIAEKKCFFTRACNGAFSIACARKKNCSGPLALATTCCSSISLYKLNEIVSKKHDWKKCLPIKHVKFELKIRWIKFSNCKLPFQNHHCRN